MAAQQALVQVAASAGRTTITLNDPENRNAMSELMADQFQSAVQQIAADPSVRVVVLTGAGRAFSGGGHLEMLEAKTRISRDENERLMQLFYDRFLSVRSIPVPVIAAMNGHAMGAGLCLALACDLRVVSSDAKLGLNFVNLGLHPGMGATFTVPLLAGAARAAELLYTGAIVSAEEAFRYGLVNRVVEAGAFPAAVEELCSAISAAGPLAIRQLKASLAASRTSSLEAALAREASCQAENYAGAEFLEGITAAREKRKPEFR